MGLFDRFKRRVKEVSDEFDTDELTVEADSVEGQQLASTKIQTEEETLESPTEIQFDSHNNGIQTDDDDWEVFDDDEKAETPQIQDPDDDWEEFDEEDEYLPQQLTRKEKKRLQKEQKQLE